MKLQGRTAIESALTAVGERLAHAHESCAIVVLGGAALNLLAIVDRPTIDVDVLLGLTIPARSNRRTLCPTRCVAQSLRWLATEVCWRTG